MDAGSVLVDKTLYSKRSNSSVPGLRGGSFNSNTLPGRRFTRIHGGDAGYSGLYPPPYIAPCAPPPPPPVYSSLPTQQSHPALLPLPLSMSLSLPSLIPLPQKTKVVARSAPYSAGKDQKKQGYSPVNAKKDLQRGLTQPQKVPLAATPNARVPRPTSAAISFCKDQKLAVDEGDKADYVYALSPPPSSLPMPSFCLRARTPSPPPPRAASCNLDAFGGGGALLPGAGASGDLRRILRL